MKVRSADLEREMLEAAVRMPMSAMRRLWAMGADKRFAAQLVGAGDLGIAQVTLSEATWEPEGPDRRLLVAVRRDGKDIDMERGHGVCAAGRLASTVSAPTRR